MTDAADLRHVREIVKSSGTSFYWAMRLLPRPRRDAMFAIYAFCREIDDIADSTAPQDERRNGLESWRREVEAVYQGAPNSPTGRALVDPVRDFALDKQEFMELINGMEMDVDLDIRAPALDQLRVYCRRVAGAVGMLAIRVFGCADAEAQQFAQSLGEALQLTNILRDVSEDARIQRLYLPEEVLVQAGIEDRDPQAVLRHPALPKAMSALAALAEERFDDAHEALARTDRAKLQPAVIMMEVYHKILERLGAKGWRAEPRIHLSKLEMLGIALRLRFLGT